MPTPAPLPISGADIAWMLVSTALVLLMTPALAFFYGGLVRVEERAQHDDDELRGARPGGPRLGAGGLLAGLRAGRRADRRPRRTPACAASASRPRAPFLTCSSWPTRAPSRSLPRRSSPARWSSACASAPTWPSSRSGRCSSTRRSRTGSGAAAFSRGSARSTSPAARWCTSTPRPRRWSPRWSSARARTTAARRMLPHNVPFMLLGAGLLWFGWFGFNAGSALGANAAAALAFANTMLAPMATLAVWTLLDLLRGGTRHRGRRRHRRSSSGWSPSRRRPASSPDGRARARRARRVPELLRHPLPRAHPARRLARRGRRARRSAASTGALLTGVFAAAAWGGTRRPARRQPAPARHPGARRAGGRRLQRASPSFGLLKLIGACRCRCARAGARKASASTSRSTARRPTRAARAPSWSCRREPRRRRAGATAVAAAGGRRGVKLIVAIIRPEKLSDVLEALFQAEVRGLTIAACRATAARRSTSRPTAARR